MLDNLALKKFMLNMYDLNRVRMDVGKVLERFSSDSRNVFGIDRIEFAIIAEKKGEPSSIVEYALNTGKPYVDNRISTYSSFPELINYSKSGFRSCAVLPVIIGGRKVIVVTALSKSEEKFAEDTVSAMMLMSVLLGYHLSNETEHEKNIGLAKYFDAAFSSSTPQFLAARSGEIVRANKAAQSMLKKSQSEIIGRSLSVLLDTEANAETLFSGNTIETNSKDKSRVFKVQCTEISEKLLHVSINDMTALKWLESRAQTIRTSRSDSLLETDHTGKILWCSENTEMVLGVKADSVIGVMVGKIMKESYSLMNACASANSPVESGPITVNLENDVRRDIKVTVTKHMMGYSFIVHDNNTERYVRSLRENADSLIELSGDIFISTNELGYIKRLNLSAMHMLNYDIGELGGKPISMMVRDSADQEALEKAMVMAKQNGYSGTIILSLLKGGGTESVRCEASVRAAIDESGSINEYMVIAKEMATKERIEGLVHMLAKTEKELEKYHSESDLKSQFIYNISHDLKTPITNIKGFSMLLYNGEFGELNNDQKNYIKIILDESDRFTQLVQQILDVAKLSSNRIKLDLQEVDLNKLGENPSIKALEEMIVNKGLYFEWKVNYDVPIISADPNRLIQVFVNFIVNAYKFTEKGGITVNSYRKGKNVIVEVKDTGIGVSREDQKKLFKPFYQVQRKGLTRAEGTGTGLGLSIVKEIVALHHPERKGKRMGVVSEPGKGSTFWFALPIYSKKKG
jgi:signal transduction histidine kinase